MRDYEAEKAAEWENDTDAGDDKASSTPKAKQTQPSVNPLGLSAEESRKREESRILAAKAQAAISSTRAANISSIRRAQRAQAAQQAQVVPSSSGPRGTNTAVSGVTKPGANSAQQIGGARYNNGGPSSSGPIGRNTTSRVAGPGGNYVQPSGGVQQQNDRMSRTLTQRVLPTNRGGNVARSSPIRASDVLEPGLQRHRKANWGANELVITQRVKEKELQDKEMKLLEMKFLQQPVRGEFFPTVGYHQVEDFDLVFLGEHLEELNDIRKKHLVYVDYDAKNKCLRIRSPKDQDMAVLIDAVRSLLKELEVDSRASAPRYLIHPPLAIKYKETILAVAIKKDNSYGNGHETVTGLKMIGPLVADLGKYSDTIRPQMKDANRERYFEHLKDRLQEMCALKSWMGMRVHFGTVELVRYPRQMEKGMSFEKFSEMMRSTKCKGTFEKKMGDFELSSKILNRVTSGGQLFRPLNGQADVKPEFMLFVFVRNGRTNETARLEVRLQSFDRIDPSGSTNRSFQIGNITTFSSAKHKTRLNVSTIFVDREFDMCHELVTNTNNTMDGSDLALQALIKKIEDGALIFRKDDTGSCYLRMDFLKDHFRSGQHEPLEGSLIVENVVLRSSSVLALWNLNTPSDYDSGYRMDIYRDRKWTGHNMKGNPNARYCGVSVYHKDWAYLLEEREHIGGEHAWDAELSTLFPPTNDSVLGGFPGFYEKLNYISRILSEAADA